MSSHLDPPAKSRGSSGRMQAQAQAQSQAQADAPRPSNPSFEDVQVQWFARTGPFPAGAPTPPPPPPSTPPSSSRSSSPDSSQIQTSQMRGSQTTSAVRGRATHPHDEDAQHEVELAADDLDDDADDLEESEVDVPLDSLVDAQELATSGERPSARLRARTSESSQNDSETDQEETKQLHPDEDLDTLVTSTRPWVRTRVWASED